MFSAIGVVTLLSGQPKEGVSVEARSETKGYYEETKTDASGNYRLRGLLPETTYTIKVVQREDQGSPRIERASPGAISVEVWCSQFIWELCKAYESVCPFLVLLFSTSEIYILINFRRLDQRISRVWIFWSLNVLIWPFWVAMLKERNLRD